MTTLTLVPAEPKPARGTRTFPFGCCPGLRLVPASPYRVLVSSNDASNRNPPLRPRS